MEQTKLYLESYNITNISIRLNPSFQITEGPIEINPCFGRAITKIDDNQAIITLKVEIKNEGNKPFIGEITIQGKFRCDNWENSEDGQFLIKETTSTILFPYLRQALSNVTGLLNITPYILPVVNTQSLFKKTNNK